MTTISRTLVAIRAGRACMRRVRPGIVQTSILEVEAMSMRRWMMQVTAASSVLLLGSVGCTGQVEQALGSGLDAAANVVYETWNVHPTLENTVSIPTDAGMATVSLFRTSDPSHDSVAQHWLQERVELFDKILVLLPTLDSDRIDEIEALERAMVHSPHFATVIHTAGAENRWWVQAGMPLPLGLRAVQFERLALAMNATSCAPNGTQADGIIITCDQFEIRPFLAAHLRERAGLQQPLIPEGRDKSISDAEGQNPPYYPLSAISMQFPLSGTGWYHYPGSAYHRPNSGFYGADDTYAVDLNLSSGDSGKPVFAVAAGLVKQSSNGWVLIEHTGTVSWQAQTYGKLYSGYGHMSNVSVSSGTNVSQGQQIGKVSNVGSGGGTHLHFALYVGKYLSSTNNRLLYSVNPASQSVTARS